MTTPKSRQQFSLEHARHDASHCLAPGLFRSLKRGERKKSKLDVVYHRGEDKKIEFSGPEPLGVEDLRVLQGLIAMSGPTGLVLSPTPKTEAGQQLRTSLETKWESVKEDALVVKGSYKSLAREIGYTSCGGSQIKAIKDCIERLWKVSIIVQDGRRRQGFRLLSEYASDETENKLYVALNPLIAQAVMGGTRHIRISMNEVRMLKGETTRLLHQRLCGWINPGESGKVQLDALCSYAWPDPTSKSTMRKRYQRVRESLDELGHIGWAVTEYVRAKFEIRRPEVR